jgi:FAD/FMN-containing dehydrogenase
MSDLVQSLIDEFGADAVIGESELAERATSYWDSSPTTAKALLRLTSTEQLSRAMKMCAAQSQTVVVQGGLTGVVAGAVSSAEDIIISLERMHQIESVDAMDGVAIGVPL